MTATCPDRWRCYSIQYLVWADIRTHPVVQVVVKARVTDAELELLQETLVIHHVERREDVRTFLSVRKKKPASMSNKIFMLF